MGLRVFANPCTCHHQRHVFFEALYSSIFEQFCMSGSERVKTCRNAWKDIASFVRKGPVGQIHGVLFISLGKLRQVHGDVTSTDGHIGRWHLELGNCRTRISGGVSLAGSFVENDHLASWKQNHILIEGESHHPTFLYITLTIGWTKVDHIRLECISQFEAVEIFLQTYEWNISIVHHDSISNLQSALSRCLELCFE